MIKPKKSVQNIDGYFVPLYEKTWDVKIDSNENNYGPSEKVIKALNSCCYKDISFYPFYGELSQKIADYNNFKIDNIKVTNGADEALQAIIQTYLENGESLITLDISFAMPEIYAEIQGGNIIKVPFEKSWVFPQKSFINALENPNIKIVYLASPNNPTGNVISENDFVNVLEKTRDKVVILDETYANYWGNSYKNYVNTYDNLFVVRSFSKDFALAGMRLGYIISNPINIENLKKVVSPFSVNALAMKAGIAALDDREYFEKIKSEIINSKQELKSYFESIGGYVYNSEANFLLVNFKEKADYVYKKLSQQNITVKLFKKGTKLENHIRVTIPDKFGVDKIKKALNTKITLVFDMDGVLIDVGNSYRVAIQKTFEKLSGKKISLNDIQEAKNSGGLNNDWDLTQYLLKKAGIDADYKEIVNVFQSLYLADGQGLINNETALFNKEIFNELSKSYSLAIYTGRPYEEAIYTLKKLNVSDMFSLIKTADDVPENMGKPNPYGLNLIKSQTISDKYYYFGDTTDDIKAAKAAGYKAIGVLPPQDKSDKLAKLLKLTGADFVINSVNNIKEVLEKNNEAVC